MAWAGITYLFSPSTVAKSSEVNQNFSDILAGLDKAMPSGGIIMWSGSVGSIPSGWYLCNGSNGTPDLRNRFIVGAGSTYEVGDTGGSTTHEHTYSGRTGGQVPVTTFAESGNDINHTDEHQHDYSGTTSTKNHLPPYYALCFIMKS